MARFVLSDRQKHLLTVMAEALKSAERDFVWWVTSRHDNGDVSWQGVDDNDLRQTLQEETTTADIVMFTNCGLFEHVGESRYVLSARRVIDLVENGFSV